MGPEAAHADRASVVECDDDADASLEDEVHAVRRLPLRGDDLVLAYIEPLTTGDELLGVGGTAERLREPLAQAPPVASLARMGQDHFLLASL